MSSAQNLTFMDYLYPKVTVVVPTLNSSPFITYTLERLLLQVYPDFEVIVIDAGSTDRTLEIISSFVDPRVRISSVSEYNRYEMYNKGISLAKGEYILFINPGDLNLGENSIKKAMDLALSNKMPHLVFGSALLRDGRHEPRVFYGPLTLQNLQLGYQPTALQACFFHRDFFKLIGKFRTHYSTRGEFDLFCRFMLHKNLRWVATRHVLVDFDVTMVTPTEVLYHFRDTGKIIHKHFGFWKLIVWLFKQKDLRRFFYLYFQQLRGAFLGDTRLA